MNSNSIFRPNCRSSTPESGLWALPSVSRSACIAVVIEHREDDAVKHESCSRCCDLGKLEKGFANMPDHRQPRLTIVMLTSASVTSSSTGCHLQRFETPTPLVTGEMIILRMNVLAVGLGNPGC